MVTNIWLLKFACQGRCHFCQFLFVLGKIKFAWCYGCTEHVNCRFGQALICIYAMVFLCDCHTGIYVRVLEYLTSHEGSKWIRYNIINTRTEMKFVYPSAEIDEIAKMISSHGKIKMISSLLHDEDFISSHVNILHVPRKPFLKKCFKIYNKM